MSEGTASTATKPSAGWRERLLAPALALLAAACCLGAPLTIGALGAMTTGALIGGIAGAVLLAIACVVLLRRLKADRSR